MTRKRTLIATGLLSVSLLFAGATTFHRNHARAVYELMRASDHCHQTCRQLHMHNYMACLKVDDDLDKAADSYF